MPIRVRVCRTVRWSVGMAPRASDILNSTHKCHTLLTGIDRNRSEASGPSGYRNIFGTSNFGHLPASSDLAEPASGGSRFKSCQPDRRNPL